MTVFQPVSSGVSFPALEKQILGFWKEKDVFRRTWADRPASPLFMLYEGPPTANGSPGVHHVLARVFKDLIPRYKTMRGFRPFRKGGWDTHGLPVELEVEKELGLSTKQAIEEYGIDRFNERCRQSVFRYVKEWEDLTERIAFWVDMKDAYVTCDNSYIETCWWILKQLWDKGLVYQDVKGTPHCPRCVTSLSSHEVALGYEENTPDPSLFIKFRIANDWVGPAKPAAYDSLFPQGYEKAPPTYLLAWTTTPWTLPGNTALAVMNDAEYALVEVQTERGPERLVLAEALAPRVLQQEHNMVVKLIGQSLVNMLYEPLYNPLNNNVELEGGVIERGDSASLQQLDISGHPALVIWPEAQANPGKLKYWVVPAPFVSLEEGTGIVHIAPAFGDEDLSLGREQGLFRVQQVDLRGNFTGDYRFAGKEAKGRFVKEVDEDIMQDLQARGLLYRREVYHHTYPFCWRCRTPLLYYAKPSWYIRTTQVKERLLEANRQINWFPEHIREGRFGEWLRNNVDWAISRERYWGTPLPFWRCTTPDCGSLECFGSIQDLQQKAVNWKDLTPVDLHRPWVDRVELRCDRCGGVMRRIPEVLDAWFDSGAMPLAQFHYPFENGSALTDGRYPGNYICEAVDQTRGWFYSLHAIATLLEYATGGRVKAPSYQNVICLGLILDEKGEKMAKSRGIVVDPWSVINAHGADALRWYLLTAAPPGNSRRFSQELVGEVIRSFVLTLWNTYNFFVTYANLDDYNPATNPRVGPTALLDRWVLSETHSLVKEVTALLEEYNPTDAGRRIQDYVERLSNWYVRRSRRRFWKSENDEDKICAYQTLHTCLVTLSKLLAPFTPFLAEEMYRNLVCSVDPKAPESVHLAQWPEPDGRWIQPELSQAVGLAVRVVSLGRAARSKVHLRVRQPLSAALVKTRSPEEGARLLLVADQIQDELNVKGLQLIQREEEVLDYRVQPNFKLLGPKYGSRLEALRKALESVSPAQVALAVQAGSPLSVGEFTILPEEILVAIQPRPGYSVTSEGGYTVAVTTEVPRDLALEGLARELVHRIQNMRRAAGFDIEDRITISYEAPPDIIEAVERFRSYIAQETLAVAVVTSPQEGAYVEEQDVNGLKVKLGVKQAR
ncbi:MAG: isoleucine--tRNA ligase [Chloroflexi bacterium]|nr:isoleucine--tRNA ligase [Chloroflexota bacterium]